VAIRIRTAPILRNGDFELGTLDDWQDFTKVQTTVVHGGTYAGRIAVGAGAFAEGWTPRELIPIEEGDEISVEGWLNSDSDLVNMGIHIAFYDANGNFLSEVPSPTVNTTTWTKVAFSATAPANARYCSIHVAGTNTDTVDHSIYADDIQVKFASKYIEFMVE
jgi:hypothetical protein